MSAYPRVASLKTAAAFRDRLDALGLTLGFEANPPSGRSSALARPVSAPGCSLSAGNRWCILPMEGWDGTADGHPSDLTRRRWTRFGESGAKIIWGGEAVAVRRDGRANPNQLVISDATLEDLADLRERLARAHAERFGDTGDLLIGLQLTHSGRYARPTPAGPAPRIAYRHPVLDRRLDITDDRAILSDSEIARLIDDFIAAARRAQQAGFAFVDVKHCHGYLGHELLSARHRPGKYGGSLDNRLRFLTEIASGIHAEAPGLGIGVRLSAYDMVPFRKDGEDVGQPEPVDPGYDCAFGLTDPGMDGAIEDADALLTRLPALGVRWVCLSAGSPYYNPHIQRPAAFPPSDGYLPPEDPLVGVGRQIVATARLKARHPELVLIGSGYSYLQEWLPHVAEYAVRHNMVDAVGLGRMVLSYHDLPADLLEEHPVKTKLLCRTFSDCTTAPRNGLVSGCYPLDRFYAAHPDAAPLKVLKKELLSVRSAE